MTHSIDNKQDTKTHLLENSQLKNENMIWNKIENKKPLAYMVDGWDGKKSDKVLICTRSGRYYVAEMYEGVLDGSEFCEFYDDQDYEIENVAFWVDINSPF